MAVYEGLDEATVRALSLTEAALRAQSVCPMRVHADAEAMRHAMAEQILADFREAVAAGRERCIMIVPVGPVGQYDLIAQTCTRDGVSLAALTLVVMDEYLTLGNDWIDSDDALSFRGHMQRHLLDPMPEALRPRVIVPDPRRLDAVAAAIAAHGGLDASYAGVGITGHLAFNDPLPGRDDADFFADLPTRIVALSPETRLINAVTAAMGNVLRIPQMAVTVGMREILSARVLRVFMNRSWQCAAIRRMLFGPVTGAFPASLIRRHGNVSLDVVAEVLALPEPGLR